MISIALSMLHESKEVFSYVSSAKDWSFTGCLAFKSERGLVYMINKTGPRTDLEGLRMTVGRVLNHVQIQRQTAFYQ